METTNGKEQEVGMINNPTIENVKNKYKTYISNIEWHIKTNNPPEVEIKKLNSLIDKFKEMLEDLRTLQEFKPAALSHPTTTVLVNDSEIEEIIKLREQLPENWRWNKCYELAYVDTRYGREFTKRHWALKEADKTAVCSLGLISHDNSSTKKEFFENDIPVQFVERSLSIVDRLLLKIKQLSLAIETGTERNSDLIEENISLKSQPSTVLGWVDASDIDSRPTTDSLLLTISGICIIGDWYKGGWRTHKSHWEKDENGVNKYVSAYKDEAITHWMPLPPAPNKSNSTPTPTNEIEKIK